MIKNIFFYIKFLVIIFYCLILLFLVGCAQKINIVKSVESIESTNRQSNITKMNPASIKTFTPQNINSLDETLMPDTIYLTAGIFEVNLNLGDGKSIIGEDKEKTILKPFSKEKPVVFKTGAGLIKNLTVSDGGKNWDCNGIYLSNSDAVIKNCIIKNNAYSGIYASYFSGIITENIIESNLYDGIKLYNSTGKIINNIIRLNKDDGIQPLHSNITIDSNFIYLNSGAGIELWFDNRSTIVNNYIFENAGLIETASGNCPENIQSNIYVKPVFDIQKYNFSNLSGKSEKSDAETKKSSIKNEEKNFETAAAAMVAQPIFDNTSKIENTDSALYFAMLKKKDFNISYRLGPDTIELPLFTKLFSQTLETPKELTIIGDSIISSVSTAAALDAIFSVDLLKLKEDSYLLHHNTTVVKNDANCFFDTSYTNYYPDFLPADFKTALNRIIQLTALYYESFEKIQKNYSSEDFEFIRDSILNTFSENRPQLNMNLRERIKSSDANDNENLKLKKFLDKLDISKLHIIGKQIITEAKKKKKIDISKIEKKNIQSVKFRKQTKYGDIIISGFLNDFHYNEDCFISIDFGGDDVYKNLVCRTDENKLISLYFDFAGNDNYITDTHFDICSAVFGTSYLYDRSGNDRYSGMNNSCASAYFGTAVINDDGGNDFYECYLYGNAAATFGYGLIIDESGNDIYQGGAYCEGFGSVKGYGVIVEKKGNDYYLSGNQIVDSIRYFANYITMSQGCGYGIRPYIPGGLGLLLDREGNDMYKADIFGQATSYWQAIGGLIDYSGDDKYISQRYSQGAGIHLGISALIDFTGDDNYISFDVSQGCGHDISFGILYDYSGDDFYKNPYLGMGAGITTAIGLLVDISGNDAYCGWWREQGHGEYLVQREFGSIGVLYDKSGQDRYYSSDNSSKDKTINIKSQYGVFYDK